MNTLNKIVRGSAFWIRFVNQLGTPFFCTTIALCLMTFFFNGDQQYIYNFHYLAQLGAWFWLASIVVVIVGLCARNARRCLRICIADGADKDNIDCISFLIKNFKNIWWPALDESFGIFFYLVAFCVGGYLLGMSNVIDYNGSVSWNPENLCVGIVAMILGFKIKKEEFDPLNESFEKFVSLRQGSDEYHKKMREKFNKFIDAGQNKREE